VNIEKELDEVLKIEKNYILKEILFLEL